MAKKIASYILSKWRWSSIYSNYKVISNNTCQIDDRNLEIIFFENFKNKQYATPDFIEDKYGIWLIGYDGNIKNYTEDDKIFLGLFDLIDSMPMRKNEMIDDKC